MKKFTALLVMVCMLLILMSTSFAMTQKEVNERRAQARETLNNTQRVTWYDLEKRESAYKKTNVKFNGICVGFDPGEGYVILMDKDDNAFIVENPIPYRFKVDTEYTMSATFVKMIKNTLGERNNGNRIALFNGEQAHLPMMSEYGL